jgi:tellurite resistance protein
MVRRFVRRAGGGRLLLLGGTVLAGVVGSEVMEQRGSGAVGTSSPGVPPPPPAGGGSLVPPPPPPLAPPDLPPLPSLPEEPREAGAAGADTAEATLPPDVLYAVVRTMVAAALADGTLSSEEKRAIDEQLDSTKELDPERLRQIHRDLVLPPSPEDLAELPGAMDEPELLFRFAVLVLEADHEASDHERVWLARLGEALGLDADRQEALEAVVTSS